MAYLLTHKCRFSRHIRVSANVLLDSRLHHPVSYLVEVLRYAAFIKNTPRYAQNSFGKIVSVAAKSNQLARYSYKKFVHLLTKAPTKKITSQSFPLVDYEKFRRPSWGVTVQISSGATPHLAYIPDRRMKFEAILNAAGIDIQDI
jgi:hypothetical protein